MGVLAVDIGINTTENMIVEKFILHVLRDTMMYAS